MIPGVIISAALGAIGALVGFGLAQLTKHSDLDETPRWPSAIGAALALAISHPLTAWINKPTADSALQEMAEQEPFYAALKANYPTDYAKIHDAVAAAIENGDVAFAKPKIRSILIPLLARELPNASDDTLFSFASLIRDEGMELADLHTNACIALFKGGEPNPLPFLTPAMAARENGIYNRLFSEHRKAGDAASNEQTEIYIQKLGLNLGRQLHVSPQQLGDALQFKGPIDLQCRVNIAFFDGFTKSWSNDNGPKVLRAMLQNRNK